MATLEDAIDDALENTTKQSPDDDDETPLDPLTLNQPENPHELFSIALARLPSEDANTIRRAARIINNNEAQRIADLSEDERVVAELAKDIFEKAERARFAALTQEKKQTEINAKLIGDLAEARRVLGQVMADAQRERERILTLTPQQIEAEERMASEADQEAAKLQEEAIEQRDGIAEKN